MKECDFCFSQYEANKINYTSRSYTLCMYCLPSDEELEKHELIHQNREGYYTKVDDVYHFTKKRGKSDKLTAWEVAISVRENIKNGTAPELKKVLDRRTKVAAPL